MAAWGVCGRVRRQGPRQLRVSYMFESARRQAADEVHGKDESRDCHVITSAVSSELVCQRDPPIVFGQLQSHAQPSESRSEESQPLGHSLQDQKNGPLHKDKATSCQVSLLPPLPIIISLKLFRTPNHSYMKQWSRYCGHLSQAEIQSIIMKLIAPVKDNIPLELGTTCSLVPPLLSSD